MTRFTDKLSIFLIIAFLGVYGYATYAQAPDFDAIFDRLVQVWSDQMFPLVMIAAAVLVYKLNFVLSWVLVLAGYMLFINWPVEDYMALLEQVIAHDGGRLNFGYFTSTLAWHGYAFLLMVAFLDVLRIAYTAGIPAKAPDASQQQGYRR